MTREEAKELLIPFQKCMFDQHGCPISDAAIALEVAIAALEQPEIIRCRDCAWHNIKINQCNRQICAVMYEDDFCSHAERRTDDT